MHTTSLPLHWACSSLLQLPFHASFFCCLEAHTTSGAFAAPVGFITNIQMYSWLMIKQET